MSMKAFDPADRTPIWFHLLALFLILVGGGAVFGGYAARPWLFADEWGRLNQMLGGEPGYYARSFFLRPSLALLHSLMRDAWGVNPAAFRLARFAVLILSAWACYGLLAAALPRLPLANLCAALLFVLYPSVYDQLFWGTINQNLGLAVALLSGMLLAVAWRRARWPWYAAGWLVATLAMLIYEGTVGLILWAALLLILSAREKSRWGGVVLGILALLYSAGRWWAQVNIDSVFSHDMESLRLSPLGLLWRLLGSYRFSLFDSWRWALVNVMGARTAGLAQIAVPAVLFAALLGLGWWAIHRWVPRSAEGEPRLDGRLLALAMLTLGAGYVPTIVAYGPFWGWMGTRINRPASVGASMVLVWGGGWLLERFGWRGRRVQWGMAWLTALLLAVVALSQWRVLAATDQAWQDQKQVWRLMLEQIPSMRADTEVLLLLPGYLEDRPPMAAKPFEGGEWGIKSAISVLYGVWPQSAQVAYHSFDDITYTAEGMKGPWWTGRTLPYAHTLVLEYDHVHQALLLRREVPAEHVAVAAASGLCSDCVLDEPSTYTAWRYLID